jgi:hypothetical protein
LLRWSVCCLRRGLRESGELRRATHRGRYDSACRYHCARLDHVDIRASGGKRRWGQLNALWRGG